MNRKRNLLHKDKLLDFVEWAQRQGYISHARPPAATYEVARLQLSTRQGNNPHIVIYRRDRGEHLTTTGAGTTLVEQYLKQNNKQARRIRAITENPHADLVR